MPGTGNTTHAQAQITRVYTAVIRHHRTPDPAALQQALAPPAGTNPQAGCTGE
jgi:hypothetical protein